jgi:hypothetical protein
MSHAADVRRALLSESGVKTKVWGPHFWKTLFYVAMGYPVEITSSPCHRTVKKQFYNFYASLQWTLPCGWCLESYRRFFQEDSVCESLDSRLSLMKWLYRLRDKVNKKLIFQEKQAFAEVRKKLLLQYQAKKINKQQLDQKTKAAEKKICFTKKSPAFAEVLEEYASARA